MCVDVSIRYPLIAERFMNNEQNSTFIPNPFGYEGHGVKKGCEP